MRADRARPGLGNGATAPCALCGSSGQNLLFSGVEDYITTERFSLFQCRECDLVSTRPVPEAIEKYYPRTYRRFGSISKAVLRALYSFRVQSWMRCYPEPGSVLEVGCGEGWMLRALQDHGWKVVGTEISASAAEHATKTTGIPTIQGGPEDFAPEPTFDLILLFQVLEHLPNPLHTLEQCARLLRPGGKIVIGVPNFGSWQARVFASEWFHLDVPRHLFHFSEISLAELLKRTGLTPVSRSWISFEHDPYGWVQGVLNSLGFSKNRLTLLLMGSCPWAPLDVVMAVIAAAASVPATLISITSWIFRKGAIMEVRCVKDDGRQ